MDEAEKSWKQMKKEELMSKKALVVWGGWEGHEPGKVAAIVEENLSAKGFAVEVSDSLDAFLDVEKLKSLDLIVPVWTMGEIKNEQLNPVCEAVRSGVGIAGCHGGMCDSFRAATEWQFMTGGQWVSHPGNDGVTYTVYVNDRDHFVTQGTFDFQVTSEQYYMHTDPANRVLATMRFPTPGVDGPHIENGSFDMPVVWTRKYGKGRVFYSSIGHSAKTASEPDPLRLLVRGMLWAAHAED